MAFVGPFYSATATSTTDDQVLGSKVEVQTRNNKISIRIKLNW